MKLYERFDYLTQWFRYQATYLEMKYHLIQVMKGKEAYYTKKIRPCDRNIGKTAALARLSAKYGIPVIVPSENWKRLIERDIPISVPKYFINTRPTAWVANLSTRSLKHKMVLIEEGLSYEQIDIVNCMTNGRVIGYRNVD